MKDKKCQRCSSVFTCNSKDINQCDCNTIELGKDLKYFLSKTQYDCLCNQCLCELKDIVQESKKETFPIKRDQYVENKHFYLENGMFVFTEYFHIVKGECCRNNCRHCAYGYNL